VGAVEFVSSGDVEKWSRLIIISLYARTVTLGWDKGDGWRGVGSAVDLWRCDFVESKITVGMGQITGRRKTVKLMQVRSHRCSRLYVQALGVYDGDRWLCRSPIPWSQCNRCLSHMCTPECIVVLLCSSLVIEWDREERIVPSLHDHAGPVARSKVLEKWHRVRRL
jgi:hypothetical protein